MATLSSHPPFRRCAPPSSVNGGRDIVLTRKTSIDAAWRVVWP
ncbi:hypothetical protein HMPREF9080_02200 [Cardiobacterium valvarum F0432]|uniref:Uncharacterized protein n=1 Tax=Cardiobacterium valvarum F0432 TaxID=797473 RepID=G9ZHH0_9GAMM|nr:hypothetical protein HMPREF9080_02200 [Cardiobacterium valvarum F0432]